MAKKKGGKKKKKGGGDAKKVEENEFSEKMMLADRQELLENHVSNQSNVRDELQRDRDEVRKNYESEVEHKDAIVRHMRRTLDHEMLKCKETREEMDEIIVQHKPKKDQLAREILALEEELKNTREGLTKEKREIVGKLTLLKELRLQKDGLMATLKEAEERVRRNAAEYKEQLRNLDCKHMFEREKFHRYLIDKLSETNDRFMEGANANLTYVIKRALTESLHTSEQLRKKADLGLELQNENLRLREKEMNLKLQLDLEKSRDNQLASKIKDQESMIANLLAEYNSMDEQTVPSNMSHAMETMIERTNDLQKEFLKVEFKHKDMEAEKKQQDAFLKPLKESVVRLRESNSRLLDVVRKAEQVFRSEVMEKVLESREGDDDDGLRSTRNELLRQFVDILHTATTMSRYDGDLQLDKVKSGVVGGVKLKKRFFTSRLY